MAVANTWPVRRVNPCGPRLGGRLIVSIWIGAEHAMQFGRENWRFGNSVPLPGAQLRRIMRKAQPILANFEGPAALNPIGQVHRVNENSIKYAGASSNG